MGYCWIPAPWIGHAIDITRFGDVAPSYYFTSTDSVLQIHGGETVGVDPWKCQSCGGPNERTPKCQWCGGYK